VLFLRIRQAEIALRHARLDEAFELVNRPDVRAHRRGQDLLTRLSRELMTRGRRWLGMDRPADAAADADKVIRLAGQLPEAVELKARATQAMLGEQQRHRRSAEVLAKARLHLHQGRPGTAQQVVKFGELSTGGLQVIMADLHEHGQRLEAAANAAHAALARHDYDAAINELVAAQRLDPANARVTELVARTHRELSEQATAAFNEGCLDIATSLESKLTKLMPGAIDVEQFRHALLQLRQAWDAIERGQPRRAEEHLRRIQSAMPHAKWITDTTDRLSVAATALESVRSGPMGLLAGARVGTGDTIAPPQPSMAPRFVPSPSPARGAPLGNRLLLQVDGAGSFVILRDHAVSIGPISSSSRVAVGLICEPNTPTLTIERVEDDYFLRSLAGGVMVNDTPTQSKLLSSGDRLALSPRCRMVFAMPVPASTTAAIDLSGARYPRGDVRRIVLMDRDVVIGPGGAAHIRVDSLNDPVVLVHRDGQLFLRGGTAVTMGEQPIDENTPLQPGQPIRGAGFGFVITAQ